MHDVAAWVEASDAERAERLAVVERLEIAVIDGTATDDERDGYLILRAPFDTESSSRFRYYGGAAGFDFDNTHEFRATPLEMVTATNAGDWMVPDDSNDTAPGLDYPPRAGLTIAAIVDYAGRVVHEVRIDEEPVYDTLLWSEIPEAATELEGFGHHEAATALLLWLDVDRDDRPSPGDDITRAAFDAMDGAS